VRIDLQGEEPCIDLKDPELGLTAAQVEAMEIHGERMVSAGAGSGKTSTLSLRYTALLLHEAWRAALSETEKPSIEAALVLTFTDKAAQEMSQRCYKQLLGVFAAAQRQEAQVVEKWGPALGHRFLLHIGALVDQFDNAYISTFHAFCTHLLRENGIRMGFNPGFRLLDELEAQELAQTATQEAYAAWRDQVDPEQFGVLRQCFRGRSGVEEAVRILLRNRSKFVDLPETTAQAGSLLDQLQREAPLSPSQVREWLEAEGIPILEQVSRLLSPVDTAFRQKGIEPLLRGLHPFPTDSLALNQAYAKVLGQLAYEDRVRPLDKATVLGSQKLWKEHSSLEAYGAAKEALKEVQLKIAHWPELLLQAESLPKPTDRLADLLHAGLSSLFRLAISRLEALHSQRTVLDFDGLQIQSLRLLRQDAALRAELRARHRFVMVDEFQDTDAIQWEILSLVGRPENQSGDRLFAVGDLKQAIYSFRGGDVSVFAQARKALGTETVLDRNFRSRKTLVAFTNALFEATMGPRRANRPSWEAHFSSLDVGRKERRVGQIGLLSYSRENAQKDAAEEGRLVAQICARLLDPAGDFAQDQFGDAKEHPNPPIVLLLRRRTHFGAYQSALLAAGIPYRVGKGVGFWERPEILDLLHGLEAAVLGDPIALVGFLRSPLIAAKDSQIQELADGHFGPAGLHRFSSVPLLPKAPPALRRAQDILASLRAQAPSTAMRSLCESLIQLTGAEHAWALDGDAGNAEANVQKLLSWMTQVEHRGWSVARSLRFFGDQIQQARRESEADNASGNARVLIQTVHSAKGLEFPVVLLAGLAAQQDPSSPLQLGRVQTGWAFGCKTPDPTASIAQRVHNVRSKQIQRRQAAERAAEDLRLFYVAVTRAEDHLFFIGDPNRPQQGSWMGHLAPFLGDSTHSDFQVKSLKDLDLPSSPSVQDEPGSDREWVAFEAFPGQNPDALSPSGLHQHKTCPVQWRLGRDFPALSGPRTKAEHLQDAAALRGTILHEMLERKCLDIPLAMKAWTAASKSKAWPVELRESQGDRLRSDLGKMATDPSLHTMLSGTAFPEAAFDVPFGRLRIQGRIDLLWKEGEEWVLTDFKSERIGPNEADRMRHREQLTAYAWASSKLLGQHVGRSEVYSTRGACRIPLPPLTPADFQVFEAQLAEVEEDLQMPLPDLKERIFSQSQERPCEDCSYHRNLCPGKAGP
jgi:ATP-dependent helicase/nuclease subunit A